MADWEPLLPKSPPPPPYNPAEDLGLNGSATSSFENSISCIKKKKKQTKEEKKKTQGGSLCTFLLRSGGCFHLFKDSLIPLVLLKMLARHTHTLTHICVHVCIQIFIFACSVLYPSKENLKYDK